MPTSQSGTNALINYKFTKYNELQQKYNELRALERIVSKEIIDVANDNNSELIGLEYAAKSASSIEDKIERLTKQTSESPEEIFSKLNDLLRYTQICRHEEIFTVAQKTITELKNKNYTLSAINNFYLNNYPKTGYKGLHLNFISPYGQTIELQIHSPESFAAKQKGHELYEKIRSISTPLVVKKELEKEIRKIHGEVEDPPLFNTIRNFQLSAEEKKTAIETRASFKINSETMSCRHGETALLYTIETEGNKACTKRNS